MTFSPDSTQPAAKTKVFFLNKFFLNKLFLTSESSWTHTLCPQTFQFLGIRPLQEHPHSQELALSLKNLKKHPKYLFSAGFVPLMHFPLQSSFFMWPDINKNRVWAGTHTDPSLQGCFYSECRMFWGKTSQKTPLITLHFNFKASSVAIYSDKCHKYHFYHTRKLMLWIVKGEYCGVGFFF